MVKHPAVFQLEALMLGQQHDLCRLQRGAAQIEEAVGRADLFFGQVQHLRKDAAHGPLTRVARRDVGALHMDRLIGQRTLVDLAV